MPSGKPAGVRCVQLTEDLRCAIFTSPDRPACCAGLLPTSEMCGDNRDEAMSELVRLEQLTRPSHS
jgi:hypothetical protein